jgi:uncharacterized membrane protein
MTPRDRPSPAGWSAARPAGGPFGQGGAAGPAGREGGGEAPWPRDEGAGWQAPRQRRPGPAPDPATGELPAADPSAAGGSSPPPGGGDWPAQVGDAYDQGYQGQGSGEWPEHAEQGGPGYVEGYPPGGSGGWPARPGPASGEGYAPPGSGEWPAQAGQGGPGYVEGYPPGGSGGWPAQPGLAHRPTGHGTGEWPPQPPPPPRSAGQGTGGWPAQPGGAYGGGYADQGSGEWPARAGRGGHAYGEGYQAGDSGGWPARPGLAHRPTGHGTGEWPVQPAPGGRSTGHGTGEWPATGRWRASEQWEGTAGDPAAPGTGEWPQAASPEAYRPAGTGEWPAMAGPADVEWTGPVIGPPEGPAGGTPRLSGPVTGEWPASAQPGPRGDEPTSSTISWQGQGFGPPEPVLPLGAGRAADAVAQPADSGSPPARPGRRLLLGDGGLHSKLLTVLVPIALLTLVGLVVLWPRGPLPPLAEGLGGSPEAFHATVRQRVEQPCQGTDESDAIFCQSITADLTSGPQAGTSIKFEAQESKDVPILHPGDRIVVGHVPALQETDSPEQYVFEDYQRDVPMLLLVALFVVVVLALGRLQGVRAIAGLGASLLVVLFFLLPSLLDGRSPILVALMGASTIAFIALYVAHGLNVQTTIALLGTLASLALTGVLAWFFVAFSRITGLATEEAVFLQLSGGQINLQGLVLAGIILGSLGVLDDVTVTQVSATWQIRRANPRYTARDLYRSALTVGRDHIASTVNTLVLAYAGAALPLLLFFRQADRGFTQVLTGELLATEVVRTLVGSVGLVASVPLTTLLAAWVAARGSDQEIAAEVAAHEH